MRQTITDHGDSPRWHQALTQLLADFDTPKPGTRPTDSAIPPIGIQGALDQDETQRLESALRALHPWRKGPWWIHGLHLDTEWRSDWKWQRLLPHLPDLTGQRILDVGSGNGYYGWQMLNAGAREVVGIDPTVLFVYQHHAMSLLLASLYPNARNQVLPLRLEDLPTPATDTDPQHEHTPVFDSVFSMGVLYHRRDHMAHLRQLRDQLRPGGTLVLETLVCESHDLYPNGRYARMRNVHLVPQPQTISQWLESLGFTDCHVKNLCPTLPAEQRSTSWMTFESLSDSLKAPHPEDEASANNLQTVEGHPAPLRGSFVAHWTP